MNEETLGIKAARVETRPVKKKAAGFTGMEKEDNRRLTQNCFLSSFFPPKKANVYFPIIDLAHNITMIFVL